MDIATIRNIDGRILVAGKLSFKNVMQVYKDSLACLQQSPQLVIDLAQVTAIDSSGVALLVEWVKWADQHDKPIAFENLPDDLVALAEAASLGHVIRTSV